MSDVNDQVAGEETPETTSEETAASTTATLDGAAHDADSDALAAEGDTPAPEGDGNQTDDDWDQLRAYQAMAERRKNQVREMRERTSEMERQLAERDHQLAQLKESAPFWMHQYKQNIEYRKKLGEMQQELSNARDAQALLEDAKKSGYEPDPSVVASLRSQSRTSELERKIEALTQALSGGPAHQQPPSSFPQPDLQPAPPAQPAAVQPAQQPAQSHRDAALNYFRSEFAKESEALGLSAEMSRHEQAVLDDWWRKAQEDPYYTVTDAMQDRLDLEIQKRRKRAEEQRKRTQQVPTSVPSGAPGRHGRPGQQDGRWGAAIRQPTSKDAKPRGLDAAVEEHLQQVRGNRR